MPISQETLLLIYGELRTLVDRIELLEIQARLPVEPRRGGLRAIKLSDGIKALATEARLAQRVAIARLLDDAPSVEIDPLTGEARPE